MRDCEALIRNALVPPTRRGAALRGLFDFLGETMDDALLDEVFRTTHSTRTEATDQLSGGNAPALTSST